MENGNGTLDNNNNGNGNSTGNGTTSWFPVGRNDSVGWRFDVITLLAVIGESSVAEHAPAITSSVLCLFPRILPAPQALLRATRPLRLPEVKAKVTGVYSGTVLDSVSFFANIIHPLEELRPYAFRVLHIKHKDLDEVAGGVRAERTPAGQSRFKLWRSWKFWKSRSSSAHAHKELPIRLEESAGGKAKGANGTLGGETRVNTMATGLSGTVEPDPELGGIRRRLTTKEKWTDRLANPTLQNTQKRPAIPPKFWSPVHVLAVLSTALSLALVIMGIFEEDGTAIVSIALLSLTSSIVGYASWWRPLLSIRSHTNKVPKGDVVIRTREGALVVIVCTDDVARELYAGTEECSYYVGERTYRALMGLGTVMLMFGVVLMGNTNWVMQVFIGGSYVFLNALYWGMGLLPREMFWDLSRYEWDDHTPEDAKRADESLNPDDVHRGVRSYTRTLWYAIRATKRTGWVKRSGAAANTDQWAEWLTEAEKQARAGNMEWNAVGQKDMIMRKWEEAEAEAHEAAAPAGHKLESVDEDTDGVDEAVQHAPADEVQPPTTTHPPQHSW